MKYWRYGVQFPSSGLHWEDGDELGTGNMGDPAAGGEPFAGAGEETVPVSVVQSIREELRELKDSNLILQAALREAKQGQNQPQEPVRAATQPSPDDPLAGLEDDDILTAGQLKRALGQKEVQFSTAIEIQRLRSLPDFEMVLKEHFPNYVKENPEFQDALVGLSEIKAAELAYKLGKKDPAYIAKKTKPPAASAEPNPNPDRVRSPAAVGAAVAPKVEDADFWNSMSDEEFDKARAKRRGRR